MSPKNLTIGNEHIVVDIVIHSEPIFTEQSCIRVRTIRDESLRFLVDTVFGAQAICVSSFIIPAFNLKWGTIIYQPQLVAQLDQGWPTIFV